VGGPITEFTLDGGLKLVEFRDVGLDLGSFLSDTVGPIVAKIQEITEPLQPIVDAGRFYMRQQRKSPGAPESELVDLAAASASKVQIRALVEIGAR